MRTVYYSIKSSGINFYKNEINKRIKYLQELTMWTEESLIPSMFYLSTKYLHWTGPFLFSWNHSVTTRFLLWTTNLWFLLRRTFHICGFCEMRLWKDTCEKTLWLSKCVRTMYKKVMLYGVSWGVTCIKSKKYCYTWGNTYSPKYNANIYALSGL